MNNYIKISIAILLFPSLMLAQHNLVNDGVSLVVEAGTDLRIEAAGISNKNGGEISNAGTIYLEKDWTQSDISTYGGNGWIWFGGTVDQNLSAVSALVVPNLRVDNGHKLILGSDVEVSNLDLSSNGNVALGSNNLVISTGGSIRNYDVNAYIISNGSGYLQQEVGANEVLFPVGNSAYNPATLKNTGTADNFQIRVEDVVYGNGTSGTAEGSNLVNATWFIEEQTAGGSNASLTTQWAANQELTGFDRNNSAIMYWDGSQWAAPSGFTTAAANAAYWTQTRSGLTSFSPFTVKDVTYSEIGSLDENSATSISLFPNPSQDYVSLDFKNTPPQQANIKVLAADGKLLFQKTALTSSVVALQEVTDLPAGTYLVHILLADGNYAIKRFIKSTF